MFLWIMLHKIISKIFKIRKIKQIKTINLLELTVALKMLNKIQKKGIYIKSFKIKKSYL